MWAKYCPNYKDKKDLSVCIMLNMLNCLPSKAHNLLFTALYHYFRCTWSSTIFPKKALKKFWYWNKPLARPVFQGPQKCPGGIKQYNIWELIFILSVTAIKWKICEQENIELSSLSRRLNQNFWRSLLCYKDIATIYNREKASRDSKMLAPCYPGVAYATPCHGPVMNTCKNTWIPSRA